MLNKNYSTLLNKLDEFIRKYYLNKILRGCIFVGAILLFIYLLIFVGFYYFNPSTVIKTSLFFSALLTSFALVFYFILKPLMALLKLSEQLSFEEASLIIGQHFSEIKDKLLNTLQLYQLAESNPTNGALIWASIDQKIADLKPIPFYKAIDFSENRKYVRYILVPLAIILGIGLIAPNIISSGTTSFIKYNEEIIPEAPFKFVLTNNHLIFVQGDEVNLELKLIGNELPHEVYIEDGKNTFKLNRNNVNTFTYQIKNIQSDKNIRFKGGGFNSSSFNLQVKPKPELLNATAQIIFPKYLNRKNEQLSNVGDLILPEGSHISWKFTSKQTDEIVFKINAKQFILPVNQNASSFYTVVKVDSKYSVIPKNNFAKLSDSLTHQISIIKDKYPTINIEEKVDSTFANQLYFTGEALDDYGISQLSFRYQIKENGLNNKPITKPILLKTNSLQQIFVYQFNFQDLKLNENQSVEYYFEVWDNDGVNGKKSTKSIIKTYHPRSKREFTELVNQNATVLKQKVQSAIKLAGNIEKESKKVKDLLLDQKQLSFEDQKQIENLLDQQKQLEKSIQEIQELNAKNNLQREEQNQDLLEKQKQIENLFNNVLDEKTKNLLEKLQALMNQRNKDQSKNELSKMQLDNKTLKNELDRILELYKQLEFEQNLQNNVDRLDDLAKRQEELANKSAQQQLDNPSLKKAQSKLEEELKQLKEDFKKLEMQNQSLERPNNNEDFQKELQEIEKDQQNSEESLEQNKPKKAAEEQRNASNKMKALSKKINDMQENNETTENNLNTKELRRLLENLLNTSFEQEKVLLNLKRVAPTDPVYTQNVQKQRTIKDNLKVIADSLFALSKRVPQIETTVNEEMSKINFNLDKSLESLGERRTGEANRFQQHTMTSINNLSLMLGEALTQLQKMSNQAKNGKGKQKSGLKELSKMQQELNNSMEKAKEQMQKLGNPGQVGKNSMSEDFGKMAQKQQMIRQALEKINREENKDGSGKLGNLNETIQEMKKTESDLVNKQLQLEVLSRQKNILTKMLEAEKSDREQNEDKERESKSGTPFPPTYIKMLKEYNLKQQNNNLQIQKMNPNLNNFYKNKTIDYFKTFNLMK